MLMSNTVLARISSQVGILQVSSAANREQDHAAGTRSVHAARNQTARGSHLADTSVSTKAWHAALERAGIADFRWHDLRPTWASWQVQQGMPLYALRELGGGKVRKMARAATRICRRSTRQHHGSSLAQGLLRLGID
jgi:integrase